MLNFLKQMWPSLRCFLFGVLITLVPCIYIIASFATENMFVNKQIGLMVSQEKQLELVINDPKLNLIRKNSTIVRKNNTTVGKSNTDESNTIQTQK
jgi:hypothetical protein